jgi:putative acetyltransferase
LPRFTRKRSIEEIRKGSRHLVRELDVVNGVYLGTGYTLTQCHVLFELANCGKLGLLELAERLLTDKSNTSRTVKKLVEIGLVKSESSLVDSRQKFFSLTAAGKKALSKTVHLADEQVESALEFLTPDEQETVVEGLRLYSEALRKSRLQTPLRMRRIQAKDNPLIARIIRDAMMEFDAVGPGYSGLDAEVDQMSLSYRDKSSCYQVLELDGKVVGGGGFAPLEGGDEKTCELRKMFLAPKARGFGLGRRLLTFLLQEAKRRGFTECYVETLSRMDAANSLYESFQFERLAAPRGNAGHTKCDVWFLLKL